MHVTMTPRHLGKDWVRDRFIGDLGRQDSEYDNTLADWTGDAPLPPKRDFSILIVSACVVLPGGLFVLAVLAVHKYLKEKSCQSQTRQR